MDASYLCSLVLVLSMPALVRAKSRLPRELSYGFEGRPLVSVVVPTRHNHEKGPGDFHDDRDNGVNFRNGCLQYNRRHGFPEGVARPEQ